MTCPDDVVERVTRLRARQDAVPFDLLGEEVRDAWRQQTAELLDAAEVGALVEALRWSLETIDVCSAMPVNTDKPRATLAKWEPGR